ncbi:hypothetical protein [Candidatus Similichlamydia epinepheli]|uniref:HflX-like GTP-binding protein n=1 Tax=Candidatus Similichlamydia epinepheli TaxID=1903953 RepID=UPI000D39B4C7|nr:hypothetical protein [Candidatus Similichlamydia epinepheli]
MERIKRALIVGAFETRSGSREEAEDSLSELGELLRSCGINVADSTICPLRGRYVSTFIGSGRLQEIVVSASDLEVDLVVFDEELTPAQQRNLETAIQKPVVDRTEIILEVFASKARTHEAKIQVQLAQIRYNKCYLST